MSCLHGIIPALIMPKPALVAKLVRGSYKVAATIEKRSVGISFCLKSGIFDGLKMFQSGKNRIKSFDCIAILLALFTLFWVIWSIFITLF